MTEPVTHGTFTLEHTYPAPPERVFGAFADQAQKARWFAHPDQVGKPSWEFDFRVGGRETNRHTYGAAQVEGTPLPVGTTATFHAEYFDIVEDERIVLAYEMVVNGARISVSLQTIELVPVDGGTRLTLTEHGAFLEGADGVAVREKGTGDLLAALGRSLES